MYEILRFINFGPYWPLQKTEWFFKKSSNRISVKNFIPRRFDNLSEVGAQPIHLCNQASAEQRHLGLLKDLTQ